MTPEELESIQERICQMAADLEDQGQSSATALGSYLRDLAADIGDCETVEDAIELVRSDLEMFGECASETSKAVVLALKDTVIE